VFVIVGVLPAGVPVKVNEQPDIVSTHVTNKVLGPPPDEDILVGWGTGTDRDPVVPFRLTFPKESDATTENV
jgi:hypothetical protein